MLIRLHALLLGAVLGAATLHAQAAPAASRPDTSVHTTVEAMKGELKRLAAAQSLHFSRHKTFATNLTPSRTAQSPLYIVTIAVPAPTGWSALATAVADTSVHCGIYDGTAASPNGAVVQAKTPACWRVRSDGSMGNP